MSGGSEILLSVSGLKVHFRLGRRGLFGEPRLVQAVNGVDFAVPRGTTFGIVGESGSGKTTTALAAMRLLPITEGTVTLDGMPFSSLEGEELRRARRRVQMVFQDPYSSLNPRARAGTIVREPLDIMGIGTPAERRSRVAELFESVGLRPEQQALFPHQFSGGQRQRIGIARALATEPDLIVCDEPVSALDAAIQAQILNLLMRLQQARGLTYLFISHDLGVVQHICDEIAVMYLGSIVEQADRISLFRRPLHPYTWALFSAALSTDTTRRRAATRVRLADDLPSPIDLPAGCRFASRCPFAEARCHRETPALRTIGDHHRVACHLVDADGEAPQYAKTSPIPLPAASNFTG